VVRSVEVALGALGADDPEWSVDVVPDDPEPDVVVIVDLTASVPDGLPGVRERFPDAQLVWLAGEPSGAAVARAVANGCRTVVTQRSELEHLRTGVRMASLGESWTSPDLTSDLVEHLRAPRPLTESPLSRRELEVLTVLRTGRSTQALAAELYISINTAKNHIRRIFQKLGAHSRLEAIAIAERQGLFGPDSSR